MLRVEQASAQIDGVTVVRSATLEIAKGGTVALIGRNGAGKTSVLRSIMGFLKLTGGRVTFDGGDLRDVPSHRRPFLGIGYAPEDRRLNGSFTLEENLRFPGEVMQLSAAELRRRMELVYGVLPELHAMRTRPAAGLSGGQGKMVALGRALVAGSRVILLDEPFQGLAPVLAQRYGAALRELRQVDRELGLLITESNPSLLRSFADEIYVIERGETSRQDALPDSSLADSDLH
ncbi:ABC transporter ATP-binding protein [Bosea sp. Tri-44]|uniref:ABC transporter ATP-binding protein n=1 Tax=Bosea sp. Tri-44 TaxID=1972137 RepID=UPI00100E7587|nr:ATP-binding cassette domain-containing protein [Bosea sp. Tri-44]RXT51232.1 ABC transporter ATP-binding protein [Bosea sp. Tri-44]